MGVDNNRKKLKFVKIWFGLVEIGGVLIFKGWGVGQKLPIRGVTCDLQCPFSNLSEVFQSKVMCENVVLTG